MLRATRVSLACLLLAGLTVSVFGEEPRARTALTIGATVAAGCRVAVESSVKITCTRSVSHARPAPTTTVSERFSASRESGEATRVATVNF